MLPVSVSVSSSILASTVHPMMVAINAITEYEKKVRLSKRRSVKETLLLPFLF
jgi:hypothetical protein